MARRLVAAALLALLAGCGGAKAPAPVAPTRPGGFLGIYSDDVFYGSAAYRRATLAHEHAAGVRLIRQPFTWADFAQAPGRFDGFVRDAAGAGIRVLPVLLGPAPGAPVGTGGITPPSSDARFAAWAASLVRRYGPQGTLWKGDPNPLPVTAWQVWNEPNIPAFWAPRPEPAAYARLLETTSKAIRRADPHAQVVSAGLPTSHLGMSAPRFLESVYAAGAKGSFDTVAVHPYAGTPAGVLRHVTAIRRVIDANHDKAGIWVTEVGWGTGGKPGALTVTASEQAKYLARTVEQLAAKRGALGIRGVVLFQWRDPKPFPGRRPIWPYFAGLLDSGGKPKPSLAAVQAAAKSVG
jgi:hypothetical protein